MTPDTPEDVFRAAMADYVAVLQGQSALASDICATVTSHWLTGASGLLGVVDGLRADLALLPPQALAPRIDQTLTEIASRLTALMGEVQRQDALRQLLASLSQMADGLRELELGQLTASTEGAAAPRTILARIAQGYVTENQRAVLARALGQAMEPSLPGAEIELF